MHRTCLIPNLRLNWVDSNRFREIQSIILAQCGITTWLPWRQTKNRMFKLLHFYCHMIDVKFTLSQQPTEYNKQTVLGGIRLPGQIGLGGLLGNFNLKLNIA